MHYFAKFSLSLQRLGGEIPSRRCISFYFALYQSDLRNQFGISSNEGAKGKTKNGIPANIAAMHTPMAWLHSYMLAGVPISQVRPLGKVHKSGHAILCALTFASVLTLKQRKKL